MAEELNEKEVAKKVNISIKYERISATDKEGKEMKDNEGNIRYRQDDYFGLMTLLNRYDSRKAGSFMKEARLYLCVKDKIEKAWIKEDIESNFTIEEASFLKKFLEEVGSKPQERAMTDYEMRTFFSVVEQLEAQM